MALAQPVPNGLSGLISVMAPVATVTRPNKPLLRSTNQSVPSLFRGTMAREPEAVGKVKVVTRLTQVPVALQVVPLVQVSGSSALLTAVHVPVVQDWQLPVHPVLQQAPSTQLFDAHWVPVQQAAPLASGLVTHTPEALHVLPPKQESKSSAFVTATHDPVVHDWHEPLQAPPQQWPSTQLFDVHCVLVEHTAPFASDLATHTPDALQVFVPVHVSASSALFTAAHVPVVHDKQEPVRATLQQWPSMQAFELHCVLVEHTAPFASGLATHTPDALQVFVPVHVSASSALFTALHVPVVHDRQDPLHVALQQWLSTQAFEPHWAFAVHVVPRTARHLPFVQVVPVPQAVVQLPQCALSALTSVQTRAREQRQRAVEVGARADPAAHGGRRTRVRRLRELGHELHDAGGNGRRHPEPAQRGRGRAAKLRRPS